jgi:hypothetical protein
MPLPGPMLRPPHCRLGQGFSRQHKRREVLFHARLTHHSGDNAFMTSVKSAGTRLAFTVHFQTT